VVQGLARLPPRGGGARDGRALGGGGAGRGLAGVPGGVGMFAELCEAMAPGALSGTLFRAGCAGATALALAAIVLPWLERVARARQFGDREGKSDSDTLNALHAAKRRTPIVGGIGVLAASVVAIVLFSRWDAAEPWLLIATLLGLGSL